MSSTSLLRMTNNPHMGVSMVTWRTFTLCGPYHDIVPETGKVRQFKI